MARRKKKTINSASSLESLSKKLALVSTKGEIAKIPLQIETTKTLIAGRKVNTALTKVALQAQKLKLKKTPIQKVNEQAQLLQAKQGLANLKASIAAQRAMGQAQARAKKLSNQVNTIVTKKKKISLATYHKLLDATSQTSDWRRLVDNFASIVQK